MSWWREERGKTARLYLDDGGEEGVLGQQLCPGGELPLRGDAVLPANNAAHIGGHAPVDILSGLALVATCGVVVGVPRRDLEDAGHKAVDSPR